MRPWAAYCLSGLALAASPALAHHSFAVFDTGKTSAVTGTVTEFQWTNPHSWILMLSPDASGQAQLWMIQLNPPGVLARQGWRPKTLTPGMKVTAIIHPLKHGQQRMGEFVGVTLPDGETLGNANPL